MSEGASANLSHTRNPQAKQLQSSSLPTLGTLLPEDAETRSDVQPGFPPYLVESVTPPWVRKAGVQIRSGWQALRRRAQSYRGEHPGRALFVIASLAFSVGIIMQVWRSAND